MAGVLRTAYWCAGDDSAPIIFDLGASISVSPCKDDFIDLKLKDAHSLKGLTGDAQVKGIGTVQWIVMDDKGKEQRIVTEAYYVPSANVRLFSTYPYFCRLENVGGDGIFAISDQGAFFRWPHSKAERSFDLGRSNLPIAYPKQQTHEPAMAFTGILGDANLHLDSPQKELLLCHLRFGHFNMHWIQK